MAVQAPEGAYLDTNPTGVLDREYHKPLLDDVEAVARDANVPVKWVWTPMRDWCAPEEIEYVVGLRKKSMDGVCGMVYTGSAPKRPMTNRMMAVAGACLRNYVSARVCTLDEILHGCKTGNLPRHTVVLVPNFFTGTAAESRVAEWQVGGLLSFLYGRQSAGQQTFLYVSSMDALGEAYGIPFLQHLRTNFKIVKG